ncbi:hypothetical protein FRC02_011520 [Tulasnella sp. 418]|nr:hypothetical protein FRC02_011520 [Tulasnella sp. 418]
MKFNTIKLFSKVEQTQKLERYLDQVNKAQVVEYRYWVGRYRLLQNEPREARELLQLAFDQCPNSSRNKRQILIYLTAASIPSGYLPHPMLLYRFDLAEPFLPLINAIRSCNAHAYRSHLNDLRWMEWFSKHEILFGLKECGDVLIWRGVIKKLFRVQYPTAIEGMSTPPITFGQPAPADQKPERKYLHYSHIAAALRISYRDASWDNDDAENVVMCLIEQGYMAGFIRHSNQTVGLDLRAPFKLPSVAVSR